VCGSLDDDHFTPGKRKLACDRKPDDTRSDDNAFDLVHGVAQLLAAPSRAVAIIAIGREPISPS